MSATAVEPCGVRDGEDERLRLEPLHYLDDRVGRRVGAQERDPPAALAEREAEDHEPQVVPLARRTGEHRRRPEPRSHPRARPSSRPRSRFVAKCSCATGSRRAPSRAPSSCRKRQDDAARARLSSSRRRAAGRTRRARRRRRAARARGGARQRQPPAASTSARAGGSEPRRRAAASARREARSELAAASVAPAIVRTSRAGSRRRCASGVEQAVAPLPRPQELRRDAGAPRSARRSAAVLLRPCRHRTDFRQRS